MKTKEKISNFLSGSVEQESVELEPVETSVGEEDQESQNYLENLTENFDKLVEDAITSNDVSAFEELLGEMWAEKELQEYGTPDVYLLKKPEQGEYHWLVEYKTKMITPVRHSSEVIPVMSLGDEKFVCWIGRTQYVVAGSLLSYVGDN